MKYSKQSRQVREWFSHIVANGEFQSLQVERKSKNFITGEEYSRFIIDKELLMESYVSWTIDNGKECVTHASHFFLIFKSINDYDTTKIMQPDGVRKSFLIPETPNY